MTAPEIVRYQPTKDAGFGHALRPATPIKAWAGIERFLVGCASVRGPFDVRLVVQRPTEWDDASSLLAIADETISRFGEPAVTVGGGTSFPSGAPIEGGYREWHGDASAWSAFLDFVARRAPWPKSVIGPVSARARYHFMWRDPDSLSAVPEQLAGHLTPDGRLESELAIFIERRSFVQPELWFPFRSDSTRLADLVRVVVAPSIPFKLAARHFRAAVPKLDQSGYQFRRFDARPLVAA
ncbi:MAG: hypothetical protein AB7N65_25030 [Vicinamibacterales bacterium]